MRKVRFRVEHDCPVARLSRAVGGDLQVWSGHRFEVVAWQGGGDFEAFARAADRELNPVRTIRTPHGGFTVWHPAADPNESITRIIERHDMMWQQPLHVRDGWESYDAISFGASEQTALDALLEQHPTQVVRRQDIDPDKVTASLFMSLAPALEAPTDKQVEALRTAHRMGYYQSPRGCTTAEAAAALGIGRSAFEERLRGGENRVMDAIIPAMDWARG